MKSWTDRKECAALWFKALRDQICAEFEAIEEELTYPQAQVRHLKPGRFIFTPWARKDGGGGTIGKMTGRVFEKVGVNISVVEGVFSEDFAAQIPGTNEKNRNFWAAGISLVAHMQNPHVPAVHMNTRMIVTTKGWFGGGADLNPMLENKQNKSDFHAALHACCNRHEVADYEEIARKCDEYFYLPHRNEPRGDGGIFYDYLDSKNWEADFKFTQDVGQTFLSIYPFIVRRDLKKQWTPEERNIQLLKRGRYVEFNLLHDRGTLFGLKTGGNIDAILMSMPPEAKWE
ncbi:MAG: oxygen-dependent coproporphyrinogen oxidase [Alphaproteobacteria bacterium]